jgi:hypothetical protein
MDKRYKPASDPTAPINVLPKKENRHGGGGHLAAKHHKIPKDELIMIYGWDNIANALGLSNTAAKRRRQRLTDLGMLGYPRLGCPPRKTVSILKEDLIAYVRQCNRLGMEW